MNHHGNCRLSLFSGEVLSCETLKRPLSLLRTTLANKPPWRFGSQADADEKRDRPHPLKGEGDTVGPLGGVVDKSTKDTRSNELTEDPAEVDVSGEDVTKWDRDKLGSVGSCDGLENTPWQTAQDFSDEQDLDIWCKDCEIVSDCSMCRLGKSIQVMKMKQQTMIRAPPMVFL